MINQEDKLIIIIVVLCAVTLSGLVFASQVAEFTVKVADHMLVAAGRYLPFVPLMLYAILALIIKNHLKHELPPETAVSLDKDQANCLTLAGFSFAVLSLLLSYFKMRLTQGVVRTPL
jgi:hypothetical protein